ncbi:Heme-binding protein A [subsurface metagenome]
MSFIRNPDYWDTTTIDGVEYQMPFMDRVVLPIIPDPATRLAALKTGGVDFSLSVLPAQWAMLDRVAPELQKISVAGGASARIVFRCDEPPFDDVRVRRAMMIGTNLEEFNKLWMATELPMHWFPTLAENPAYVPLEELPADIRILYDYNPPLARQLLAEADYPEGEIKLFTNLSGDDPLAIDTAALIKDQWAKIGIEVEIDAREQIDYYRVKYSHPPLWTGTVYDFYQQASPYLALSMSHKTGSDLNYGVYSSPELDALIAKIELELDVDEQTLLIKEASLLLMRDVASIPCSLSPIRIYWWPWLKNYYGEYTIQDDCCFAAILPYIWIDQDLKEALTGKR